MSGNVITETEIKLEHLLYRARCEKEAKVFAYSLTGPGLGVDHIILSRRLDRKKRGNNFRAGPFNCRRAVCKE